MRLVLKYYGGGADGRHSSVVLPIEADSPAAAAAAFTSELEQAVLQDLPSFICWGHRHYVYNFMNETTPERVRYLQRQVERNPRLALSLTVVEQQGRLYWLRLPKFLTLDEWFSQAPTVPSW